MLNGVRYIKQSIDRLGISVPYSKYQSIVQNFGIKKSTVNTGHSIIELFDVKGSRVQCERMLNNEDQYNNRAFLTLLQPTLECQIAVKSAVLKNTQQTMYKQFNPSFSQIELALDFVVNSAAELDDVQEYINHHVSLKYSRSGSRRQYENTLYIGKKGVVREGSKGVRVYDPSKKRDVVEDAIRVELQLNRAYLTANNITVQDMPILPDKIDVFNYIQFIDNIDAKIVDKVVKKVQSTLDKSLSPSRLKVIRSSIRKQLSSYLPAKRQYENLSSIRKKYGVKVTSPVVSVFNKHDFNIITDTRCEAMDVYVYAENSEKADEFICSRTDKGVQFVKIGDIVDIANAPDGFNVLFVGRCCSRQELYRELHYMVIRNAKVFDINKKKAECKVLDIKQDMEHIIFEM